MLRILNQQNAPVPHLIACRDHYIIQQDVGSPRLSECMSTASDAYLLVLLEAALRSLHAAQQIGKSSAPLQSLVTLGNKPQWLHTFVRTAERLGEQLQLPVPALQWEQLVTRLTVAQPCFIKWDARPGNAVVRDTDKVIWIDWEHCGRRHPLDDVAWLLTDEYTPFLPAIESELIPRILPAFASGYSPAQAHEYLRLFGTFHSCIRLELILRYQTKEGWRDFAKCLQFDRVGVVQDLAMRVAKRGASWANHSALTQDLTPWFDAVADRLAAM